MNGNNRAEETSGLVRVLSYRHYINTYYYGSNIFGLRTLQRISERDAFAMFLLDYYSTCSITGIKNDKEIAIASNTLFEILFSVIRSTGNNKLINYKGNLDLDNKLREFGFPTKTRFVTLGP